MYAGRIVEEAETDALFADPRHPYTQGLLASVPTLEGAAAAHVGAPADGQTEPPRARLTPIRGQPPDLTRLPSGCSFAPRCPHKQASCETTDPSPTPRPDFGSHACLVDIGDPKASCGRVPADT
jgi:oligopeptide/dipeptide ABC transporter ATP-binding protein